VNNNIINMKKIVITGGLGYVGTELCKIYSGEARYKNIIVVDSKFVSERVKQLRDWGINFIQCDILDDKIRDIVKDADIVYHLAGVTDVAYTKTESNVEKDRQIQDIGINGTLNILNSISDTCKIVFPSTHVVYEGFDSTKFDLTEYEDTKPVLTYAKGKVKSEQDIIGSNKNYVILRFGSVYGYSTDTMRINIMPNLFSKIASQDGIISLFGGGVQHKSLVNIIDVVRCLKYVGDHNINKEIYHLSNENMTVKEVALLCKEINPKVTIIETDDEIPNLGYTISNKKLLSTGFKFLYNIKDSIREMISNWSETKYPEELEYIVRGGKEYIDSRGKISNFELTEPINLIGYIESVAGSVRANHYHPIQEQKCLLIKGSYVSVIQDLSIPNAPIDTKLIKAGDIAVIRPNVAHTMVFLEDSIFLNLVRGEREHDNYGITHTIPYILVDEDFRKSLIETYKTDCRCCGNNDMKRVISLGMSPLANNLLDSYYDQAEKFPLEMDYCGECHNCQLSVVVPPGKMFDNYLYVSSTAKTFRDHFENAAIKYINDFNLTEDSLVVDIGSNDGVFLKPLKDRGIRVLGVEPATNVAKIANDSGIETINSYFDYDTVSDIVETRGKANIVTASNVFAHSDKVKEIALDAFRLLEEDGSFIVEVQYLFDTMNDLTFDNIYHEHVNYWSVTSINNFFTNIGLSVVKVEHVDTHGGSIRVYVRNIGYSIDSSVVEFLEKEEKNGMLNYDTYKQFGRTVESRKSMVNKNLAELRKKYKTIVGYGSPAKATTSLNYFGIDSLDYIIEDNQLKQGKYVPGINTKIVGRDIMQTNKPDVILILAWNFAEYIIQNNQHLVESGIKLINIKDLESDTWSL